MQYTVSQITTQHEVKGFETNIICSNKIYYSVYGLTKDISRERAENLASLLNSFADLKSNQLYHLSLI